MTSRLAFATSLHSVASSSLAEHFALGFENRHIRKKIASRLVASLVKQLISGFSSRSDNTRKLSLCADAAVPVAAENAADHF